MNSKHCIVLYCLFSFSCTNTISVKNEKQGKLTASHYLALGEEKKILLDYDTAPNPPYMQMLEDESGKRILTFLNPYMNAIYFFDYEKGIQIGKTAYEKQGPNSILRMTSYYIHNMDSIYVYNMPMIEIALTDSAGNVKSRISLRDNRADWYNYLPQYLLSTSIPVIKIQDKLILTGLQTVAIPSESINELYFAACVDIKTNEVEHIYTYPEELYGSNTNWEGDQATFVYPELSPAGEMIHSFPMSHNIYVAPWNSNDFKTRYAGSNNASTIHSINLDPKRTPNEVVLDRLVREDMYTAILHDPYRHIYYRFMLQGISGATITTPLKSKPVVVIIMDENFNYLGETIIGTGEEWNWENSFVTPDGLMMEYIDLNVDSVEEYLILKTFTVEKINR